ncbi:hypothetical protein CC80DRAFT_45886 [Byssothecium circinans]|uniref:Uncharacterized protein n=1 Tax=Byssothecium circinans TaxID=147558 RepID=A0A6A5TXX9_9PLEO|nr:hypothetical protein CC80DRAFT_45886 [Byssothecium circinans]
MLQAPSPPRQNYRGAHAALASYSIPEPTLFDGKKGDGCRRGCGRGSGRVKGMYLSVCLPVCVCACACACVCLTLSYTVFSLTSQACVRGFGFGFRVCPLLDFFSFHSLKLGSTFM